MKNLNECGVLEMNTQELKKVDGGFLAMLCAGLIIAAATVTMTDWDNFKRGLMGEAEV
ncbi:class IIb bacteriocin, lactobin A/cerein 7B family [Labilibaculum manganireducens]|uniref:class IIb bacteriocin, lactobin A/cerein 7B family n=1 Tax=Labilibaculum manganireducens TaxID=1940525 RepID=UPI0029F5915E|nr:class IIb bacteriocin, lactobin A/cerein 7B family [Labilibaculum manganireducens]